MKELIIDKVNILKQVDDIKILFEYFFENKMLFFILFLLSVEYIFLTEKDKKIKSFFTIYIIIIFCVIWNPICIKILKKFINFGAMYRIYYMLPITLTVIYAIIKIVSNIKNKSLKIITFILLSCILIFTQDSVFTKDNTIKVNNWYKLPDETVNIAEIIENDDIYKEKRAMIPYGMSSQIQQIYADIYLPYTRIVYNVTDENGNPSPIDSDYGLGYQPIADLEYGNVAGIGKYAKEKSLNYIVVYKSVNLNDSMESIGFEYYKETVSAIVYRKILSK